MNYIWFVLVITLLLYGSVLGMNECVYTHILALFFLKVKGGGVSGEKCSYVVQ